jgi:hypothetical protein
MLKPSDEGKLIITTLDNGEEHLAFLRKFDEIPGWSRISFCNESGEFPDEKSRIKNAKVS